MNKKNIKQYLIPGALGLVLVTQVQPAYAQEAENSTDTGTKEAVVSESYEKENNTEKEETYSVTEIEVEDKTQTKEREDKETKEETENINSEDYSITNIEEVGSKSEKEDPYAIVEIEEVETEKGKVIPQGVDNSQLEKEGNKNYSVTEIEEIKKDLKGKGPFRYNHVYEDENYNKNFQDHAIVVENDGTYKFKKGKELTQEEIDQEFEEYKKNASSFVKIQKWIPKLKEMNLLDLEENEKSTFYRINLKNGDTIYSAKGFNTFVDINGNAYVHDLTDDKVYLVSKGNTEKGYDKGPKADILVGSASEDIKNQSLDITDERLKPRKGYLGDKTVKSQGSFVRKIVENGVTYYEFYEGIEDPELIEKARKRDLDRIEEIMQETPSELMNQWGEKHKKEILDRAYKAALVNSYISKHPEEFEGMTEEDHKNIIDYVYRFGLNFKSDESKISKSEDNGYVDVSPMGYATRNEDGSYKYRYKVSFNSITSNDRYSSTHLDIYAPTMAKNIKFFLTGVQKYILNEDGSYSYEHKDVNVELGRVSTEDKETRNLIKEDYEKVKNQRESAWNNEEYKHKENIFSIPYYNDINTRTKLDNKVVEFDKNIVFGKEASSKFDGSISIDEEKYKKGDSKYSEEKVFRPQEHYRHFRLVNPQHGGPISFIVEFDISEKQVKESPNIGLGANILSGINLSDPTAFNMNRIGYDGDYSSSRPGGRHEDGSLKVEEYDEEVDKVIKKTLHDIKSGSSYNTIFNHPELIKPGNFDINGFYGNMGGAPSEYTGDESRIGLKVGKNIFDYGQHVESKILYYNENRIKRPLNVNMRSHGASSFDIGVQIANGYGRYGDYRVNTRINDDKFITKLMTLDDVSLTKSNNLVAKNIASMIEDGKLDYEDKTDEFRKDGKVDTSKKNLEDEGKVEPSEPGNGGKDLLSDNVYFGPSGIESSMSGSTNVDSSRGGVDVTPIRCAKQADGTWIYEYQISLRGVHSSDHGQTASGYNIVMPGFVKNVKFTLIGNNDPSWKDPSSQISEYSDIDLKNYENILSKEEKLIIEKVKESLRKANLSDELTNDQIKNIFSQLQTHRVFNKNEELSINTWKIGENKHISSLDELNDQYDKHLKILNSIPNEVYEIIGKKNGKSADEAFKKLREDLRKKYDESTEDIENQIEEGKDFLTDKNKPEHILNSNYELEKRFVIASFNIDYYEDIFDAYKEYFENIKDKKLEEVYKEFQNDEIVFEYKNKIMAANDQYADKTSEGYKNALKDLNEKYQDKTSLEYKFALDKLNKKYIDKSNWEHYYALEDIESEYKDKLSKKYKRAFDNVIIDYSNNLRKIELSRNSWTGESSMLHEYQMGDYKDLIGNPLNMITKLGYRNIDNNGIYENVDLSKVDVYTFGSRGNTGVVGLRVTFEVDDDQVRKTPYIPLDVRNTWKCSQEGGGPGSYEEGCQDLAEYNNMATKYISKKTNLEISQSDYSKLSDEDKENYYPTNYYYVEHPEYITRDMFDIHGLHTEPSADVTSYTGKWQSIGEDVGPWEDNLVKATFDYYSEFQLYKNPAITYMVGVNEDYRDIAVVGPCATQIRKVKEKKEISINKEWLRFDENTELPDEITVVLTNGKDERKVKLTKENGYKILIDIEDPEDPLSDYRVKELEVPGYKNKETNITYRFEFRDSVTGETKDVVYLINKDDKSGEVVVDVITPQDLFELIKANGYKVEHPLNDEYIKDNRIILENGVLIIPRGLNVNTMMNVQLINESIPEKPEEPETPPETPPEEPETPPETPPEEPEEEVEEVEEVEEAEEEIEEVEEIEEIEKVQTPKQTHDNPKTEVEGIGGMFALMASSLAGLFVTGKRRKNK